MATTPKRSEGAAAKVKRMGNNGGGVGSGKVLLGRAGQHPSLLCTQLEQRIGKCHIKPFTMQATQIEWSCEKKLIPH